MSNTPEGVALEIPFELAALSKAYRYQRWTYRTICPYLGKRVLEIGAGCGNMSRWFEVKERLILTEASDFLMGLLTQTIKENLSDPEYLKRVSVRRLDVEKEDLSFLNSENLDTIISFNVLEHIEDDAGVLKKLVDTLSQSQATGKKNLVVFVPAHPWAFGSMDKSFGHFRRYSKKRLLELCQADPRIVNVTIQHFNLFGLPGWWFNGRILKTQSLGTAMIKIFEMICPFLSPFDDFIHRFLKLPIGQSVLCVMEIK